MSDTPVVADFSQIDDIDDVLAANFAPDGGDDLPPIEPDEDEPSPAHGAVGAPQTEPEAETPEPEPTPEPGSQPRDPTTGQFKPKGDATAPAKAPSLGTQAASDASAIRQQPDSGSPFKMPDGGSPYPFRVDGTDVVLDGAVIYPDGTVAFSPKAWKQLQPQYLGNRGQWMQERRDYQSALLERERQVQLAAAETDKMFEEMHGLLSGPRDQLEAWLADYDRNAPVMLANIKAARAVARAEALEARQRDFEDTTRAQQLLPQIQSDLRGAISTSIQRIPELAVLGTDDDSREMLFRKLWDREHTMRASGQLTDENAATLSLFFEARDDIPSLNIRRGDIVPNPNTIVPALRAIADEYTLIRERLARANQAQARNEAALTPTGAQPPRSPTPTRRQSPTSSRRAPSPTREVTPTTQDLVEDAFAGFTLD